MTAGQVRGHFERQSGQYEARPADMSPNCCDAGRIVSVAVIVAVGVNTEGQREVLGVKVGASEAESFWTEFLRSLNRRGLRGVKLVISDSHEGIKAAASKVLKATWQRCRVHFMRNALAYANKTQRRMVSAAIGTCLLYTSRCV